MKNFTHALVVIVILSLTSCTFPQYAPNEGTWYCEELQTQICFDRLDGGMDPVDNSEARTFVIVDNEKVVCTWINQRASVVLSIISQDTLSDKFHLGQTIYELEYVRLSDTEYTVKDREGNIYIFVRQE